ncbi:MAG: DNA/RNA helicase domain-containing protein [bacterium]
MLIYQGTKRDFKNSLERDTLAKELDELIYKKMNRRVGRNEYKSWENSMQYMYKVLNDEDIPSNAGVAVEYNIPNTSKRIDFILSGLDRENIGNTIIIELKQWSNVNLVKGRDALVETYVGNALRKVPHPSYQVWSYCTMIEDYNTYVQNEDIKLNPCAYLHNYDIDDDDDNIINSIYEDYIDKAPVFAKGDIPKLREFIKKFIKKGDNENVIYSIENAKIKPSKSLQNSLRSMLNGNDEFVMIDEQKVVFEDIMALAQKTKEDGKKRVYIVEGGPGTGKSVVAVNLLVNLTNKKHFCQFVSKNSAPRSVYTAKLTGTKKKTNIDNLFKSSGSYVDVPQNYIDTLIVDEAHRLNEKSGFYSNLGENQIKEIIDAAKFSVFFIDELQKIHIKDIGSIKNIKKWANKAGAEIHENKLKSQFRCNGSEGYIAWVDNVLDIRETANYSLDKIDYDFKVFDNPKKLKNKIMKLNEKSNHARLLAGYCWEWPKEGKNDPNYKDIKIDDFEMSWNLNNTDTYAIDEGSVHQVGCIHTAQGLEFDYVGVIIGEDMRYENGKIVTDYNERYTYDSSIRGIKKMAKSDPEKANKLVDRIIKNTYRTLMTRGMKGCYIYCVDDKLNKYFKDMM